jgi:hypothetical protein
MIFVLTLSWIQNLDLRIFSADGFEANQELKHCVPLEILGFWNIFNIEVYFLLK